MKTYREIALQYAYNIDKKMCDCILAYIDKSDIDFTYKELSFFANFNIPVFERGIKSPKQLNAFLTKLGKQVYVDYLTNSVTKRFNSIIKLFTRK